MNDGQIRATILEEAYVVMKKMGSIKGIELLLNL